MCLRNPISAYMFIVILGEFVIKSCLYTLALPAPSGVFKEPS